MIEYSKYSELRKELADIHIDLDTDPASTGVGTLNSKIAEVHALKDRVATILAEAIANVAERDRTYNEAKIVYEAKFDAILNNDAAVQTLKSEGLRRAACNSKLPDEFARMNATQIDLADAESFQKIVQAKYNLLDSANTNISRQISVIQLQVDIGEINRPENSQFSPFRGRELKIKQRPGQAEEA
jgi:hypothetical protein